ncbi:MAG: AraC family transcriptional regulator [Bacteroidota bacterium]
MKTIIQANELEEMFFENFQQKSLTTSVDGLREMKFSSEISTGLGQFSDISFDGLYIGFGELDLNRTTQIHYRSGHEIISMLFMFTGGTIMQHDGLHNPIELSPYTHNLFYLNEEVGKKEWMTCQNTSFRAMEISLTPEFFLSLFPEGGNYMKDFVKGVIQKRSKSLTNYQPAITPQMMHIIHDIMNCNKPLSLRKLFLGSRVMELLMLQIDQMQSEEKTNGISNNNKELMFEVKHFLESNLEPDFSIHSLAKNFGTNEYTLKKEFKSLFGKSIFDYWNHVRFDYAKQLLKDGYSVQQLAFKLGYSNTQNFSTAFKRRFGMVPSYFKG